jgi:Z1 domain
MLKANPQMLAWGLIGDATLTDELLTEVLARVRVFCPDLSESEVDGLRRELEATIGVTMSEGIGLRDRAWPPWLDDKRAAINWRYWGAFKNQLASENLSNDVKRVLDKDTDNILDYCGNPGEAAAWRIRGLVMGDVQSGKTSNYTSLINKAADVGYQIIVILTGMIEDLRQQTQERLDIGFIGRESNYLLRGDKNRQPIGVGRFRDEVRPNVLTSMDSDFLTANAATFGGIPLVNVKQPVLLVIKKNKSSLTHLIGYLEGQRPGTQLDIPLLVVDDESDNASVNARSDESPAMINALIRKLLARFRRASYVGYTATPFANVFINPDVDDLFPSDFVYGLSAPKNYIGVTSMFSDDGAYASQVVDFDDAEGIFPFKHQRDLPVGDLPESLRDAVRAFLISTTVRDMRREKLRHRSMLVNVTRFTDVQQRIAERLEAELYDLKEEVKQFLAAPGETWKARPALVALKKIWDDQYGGCGFDWDVIRNAMFESVEPIKVLTINQKTAAEQKLNYRLYDSTEKGRRVIAVGGLTLSRGLTLMGLSISYFKRDSKAYDTLLQMGRWFGYRPGYDDLCRVWMPAMVQDWFEHIGRVVTELRSDLLRMHASRQPPRRFGIRVKCHPDLLLITARNKMRHGEEVDVAVSYSGHAAETPYLPARPQDNVDNLDALGEFLSTLKPANRKEGGNQLVYREVAAARVAAFLTKLKIRFENATFSPDLTGAVPLLVFIAAAPNELLREWDVCLAQGEGDVVTSLKVKLDDGQEIHPKGRRRQFEKVPAASGYRKLNKHRVGDVSDEKLDLTETELENARELWELERSKDPELGVSIPGHIFRRFRKRPLLTVSLVQPGDPKPGSKPSKRAEFMMAAKDVGSPTLLALSLSFPIFGDDEAEVVTYRFNTVALRQVGMLEDEEDDSDD